MTDWHSATGEARMPSPWVMGAACGGDDFTGTRPENPQSDNGAFPPPTS
jgi:hypothetical protein